MTDEPQADLETPPPVMGTWPRLYALVVGNLALLVAVFWWITRSYA